jgi:hypothetical protein
MPTNNYGPYYITGAAGSGQVGNPSLQTPPQSPSGSVIGEASTWEYANGELAATFYTSNLVSAAHDGVAFGGGDEPSPALNVAQTLPAAPSGSSYEQQGAVAISNTLAISESFAGLNPASVAVNNFAG